mmetsp:Transcript_23646/g.66363  ORF Transcript_23646/g.66363 Transcript_23646/m.66363 type:complete len:231 (-) Transcript_23646:238-930(-)
MRVSRHFSQIQQQLLLSPCISWTGTTTAPGPPSTTGAALVDGRSGTRKPCGSIRASFPPTWMPSSDVLALMPSARIWQSANVSSHFEMSMCKSVLRSAKSCAMYLQVSSPYALPSGFQDRFMCCSPPPWAFSCRSRARSRALSPEQWFQCMSRSLSALWQRTRLPTAEPAVWMLFPLRFSDVSALQPIRALHSSLQTVSPSWLSDTFRLRSCVSLRNPLHHPSLHRSVGF